MGIFNTTEEAAAPTTPAAGRRVLYPKADGWYEKDDAGVEVRIRGNSGVWCGTAGGTANALTLTPATPILAYEAGMSFIAMSGASANTGATTINVSGVGAIAAQVNGAACAGGEIPANQLVCFTLNSTTTAQITLPDEQGTFTPYVYGASVAGAGTYTTQTGYYVKRGKVVFVQIYLAMTAHTGTGNLVLGGLPFSAGAATSRAYGGLIPQYVSNLTLTANNILSGVQVNSGAATGAFVQSPVGGGSATAVAMDTAFTVELVGHYFTA